jgi:hypothetical protein
MNSCITSEHTDNEVLSSDQLVLGVLQPGAGVVEDV